MLSPSLAATPAIAAVVLAALLAWLMVRAIRKDRREYGRFKRYRTTKRRQALYRKWVLESFLVFGGSAVVVTLLVWQHIPLFFGEFGLGPDAHICSLFPGDDALGERERILLANLIGLVIAGVVGLRLAES